MDISQSLLDSLSEKGWAYADDLISPELLKEWRDLALQNLDRGHFRPAQIAAGHNPNTRSDSIHWLDEQSARYASIFAALESWRQQLTRGLTLSAPDIEAHWAHYSKGQFYAKHCDQPRGKNARVLTFVVYVHEMWKPGFGGELAIFPDDVEPVSHMIEPRPGRVVFFQSDEVWHQVQESNFQRLSLTGWFRKS
jgi:SM-20-related protein